MQRTLAVALLLTAPFLSAQDFSGSMRMGARIHEQRASNAAGYEPVVGKPYQGTMTLKHEQRLADGTVISTESVKVYSRNTAGQVREEAHNTVYGSAPTANTFDRDVPFVSVADPIAHTLTTWLANPKSKVVRATIRTAAHQPSDHFADRLDTVRAPRTPSREISGTPSPQMAYFLQRDAMEPKVTSEDLGARSEAGLLITGKRLTTVIPVGSIGNSRPLVATHEVWISSDLGIVVKEIDHDPRTGDETLEFSGITTGEPDQSLFLPPAGAKVRDETDGAIKAAKLGGPDNKQ